MPRHLILLEFVFLLEQWHWFILYLERFFLAANSWINVPDVPKMWIKTSNRQRSDIVYKKDIKLRLKAKMERLDELKGKIKEVNTVALNEHAILVLFIWSVFVTTNLPRLGCGMQWLYDSRFARCVQNARWPTSATGDTQLNHIHSIAKTLTPKKHKPWTMRPNGFMGISVLNILFSCDVW